MNDIGRKLFKQAQDFYWNETTDPGRLQQHEDKLLELIVKECAKVMADVGDYEAAAEIELHFGIENE